MVITVLQNYNIDIHNVDSIDLLIEEAQNAQIQSDPLAFLKKPFKILSAIIIPVIVFVAQKIGDSITQDELVIIATQTIR